MSSTLSSLKNQNSPVSSSVVGSVLAVACRGPGSPASCASDPEAPALEAVRLVARHAARRVPHLGALGVTTGRSPVASHGQIEHLDLVVAGRERTAVCRSSVKRISPGGRIGAVAVVVDAHHARAGRSDSPWHRGTLRLPRSVKRRRLRRSTPARSRSPRGRRRGGSPSVLGAGLASVGEVVHVHGRRSERDARARAWSTPRTSRRRRAVRSCRGRPGRCRSASPTRT